MKPLVLLPLTLAAVSCIPTVPYNQQRPPQRNGEVFYPYGNGPAPRQDGYDRASEDNYEDYEPQRPAPRNQEPENYPEPQPKPQPQGRKTYPMAEKTDKPGMVLSPYAPYNVIDVEDFKSGALAKDPSNGKIFQVP